MHPETERLKKLPLAVRLLVLEELWDELAESGDSLIVPDWQRQVAEERLAELQANPTVAISEEELWRRVDAAKGKSFVSHHCDDLVTISNFFQQGEGLLIPA